MLLSESNLSFDERRFPVEDAFFNGIGGIPYCTEPLRDDIGEALLEDPLELGDASMENVAAFADPGLEIGPSLGAEPLPLSEARRSECLGFELIALATTTGSVFPDQRRRAEASSELTKLLLVGIAKLWVVIEGIPFVGEVAESPALSENLRLRNEELS